MVGTEIIHPLCGWKGREIACRMVDGRCEEGVLLAVCEDCLVLRRKNREETVLFRHAIRSVEQALPQQQRAGY